jgi:uncharacterized membrane protein
MTIPFLISVGMLITMTFLSAGLLSALPEGTMLPIRFDMSGNPAGFASAPVALFLLPAVMLTIILTLTLAPKLKRTELESPILYTWIWLLVVFALSVGHGLIIRQALFALSRA